MFWLIPIVAGVAAVIAGAASAAEQDARRRWHREQHKVERSLEEHRQNIQEHLRRAQASYDYYFLVDLHHSSVQTANAAYGLLADARTTIGSINKMLRIAKTERESLRTDLDHTLTTNDRKNAKAIRAELQGVHEIRQRLFRERDEIFEQRESFLDEVRKLNARTRQLKERIRHHCGTQGAHWHERLEARKEMRRLPGAHA